MKNLIFTLSVLLTSSGWAQVNVESWPKNSVSTPIGIPCGPSNAPSGEHEWTNPYPVADGHENKVTVRFTSGTFRYGSGEYQIAYRFKNGYAEPVDFEAEFETQAGGRTTKSTENYGNIKPGDETSSAGRWTICQTMASVRMKFIRVGHVPGAQQLGVQQFGAQRAGANQQVGTVNATPGTAAGCSGSGTLCIFNLRRGTRCGKASSVEVDIQNDSSQNLRGFVVFQTPKGKVYDPTDILKPGQVAKNVHFVCDGTDQVYGTANIGQDPSYPPKQ